MKIVQSFHVLANVWVTCLPGYHFFLKKFEWLNTNFDPGSIGFECEVSEIMKIIKITDSNLKSEICNSILRVLPLWFGIESTIVDYVNDVKLMQTWVAYEDSKAIGFVSINRHFSTSAEIHAMGVLEKYNRKGIGHQMLQSIEADLKKEEVKLLTVETLSESRPDENYSKTREFYLNSGFVPLEEFKTLWGEHNPCLFLVKTLVG